MSRAPRAPTRVSCAASWPAGAACPSKRRCPTTVPADRRRALERSVRRAPVRPPHCSVTCRPATKRDGRLTPGITDRTSGAWNRWPLGRAEQAPPQSWERVEGVATLRHERCYEATPGPRVSSSSTPPVCEHLRSISRVFIAAPARSSVVGVMTALRRAKPGARRRAACCSTARVTHRVDVLSRSDSIPTRLTRSMTASGRASEGRRLQSIPHSLLGWLMSAFSGTEPRSSEGTQTRSDVARSRRRLSGFIDQAVR
jgi:hypothetical protein